MEVLTTVDADADPGAPRARRVLLARPHAARAGGARAAPGELLHSTRSRARTRASSPSGRSSTATRRPCCSSTGRRGSSTTAWRSSPIEVHLHISGGWLVTVRHARLPRARRAPRRAAGRRARRGLRRLPRARRADGRALPGDRPPRGPHRRPRGRRSCTTRASRSSARSTGSSRRSSSSTAGSQPQRDHFPAASAAILALPGPERGASSEYLRDVGDHLVQVAGELQRQIDDLTTLTSTFFNANATPPEPPGHAADRDRDVLPRLDAGDELLRPELRLADRPRRVAGGVPALRGLRSSIPTILARGLLLEAAGGVVVRQRLAAGRLPAARRADPRRLLLRRVLQPDQGAARARGPRPARGRAGLPAQGVAPRRDRRGDRRPARVRRAGTRRTARWVGRLGRARGQGAARGRPDRAVGDRDDDRGAVRALRPPRDRLPRLPRAAHARDAQRPRGRRGRGGQADPVLPRAPRPLARADRRRLGRARRGRDRRLDRRAGVLVGRARRRHRPARADRGVRRRHGRGGAGLRRPLRRRR